MKRSRSTIVSRLLLVTLAWLPLAALGQNALSAYTQQQTQFLPVDDAYRLDMVADGDQQVLLQWVIAPEYYLYRHAFKARARSMQGPIDTQLAIAPGLAKEETKSLTISLVENLLIEIEQYIYDLTTDDLVSNSDSDEENMAPLQIWNDLPGSPVYKLKQLLKET